MRVTEGMRYAQILGQLSELSTQHAKASQQALTGLRVDAPSSDPIAAAELARVQASMDGIQNYKDTVRSVAGDAELSEAALAQVGDLLVRAKEIATQASNGGLSANDRMSLAGEVQGLKSQLVSVANTRGARGFIFAGSKVETSPFDSSGSFFGDDIEHAVDIGTGVSTVVSTSGAKAFTATGGRDVFADLDSLDTALLANDAAGIRATLTTLEASRVQVGNVRSQSGLLLKRLESSSQVFDEMGTEYQRRTQEIGAVNPAEAYSNLAQLASALDRSVAVSRQILNASAIQRFG